MTSTPAAPVGFDADIRPLFRPKDVNAMRFAFDLTSYGDVRDNAEAILERLRAGDMPCDEAWPSDRIDLFERWVHAGSPR
jgi:hypothetical protein